MQAQADPVPTGGLFSGDAWVWWQARRLRYNVALAAAGWAAYGLDIGLFAAFGRPAWRDWQGGVSMTLFLGIVYLAIMGVANICYLLGPLLERQVAPNDIDDYRKTSYAMGFWGSVAFPFLMPLANLALLIGGAA